MVEFCTACGTKYIQEIQEFVVECGKVSIPRVKLPVSICPNCKAGIVQVGLLIEGNVVKIQNIVAEVTNGQLQGQ